MTFSKQKILKLHLEECFFSSHHSLADITFNDHYEETAKLADQKFIESFLSIKIKIKLLLLVLVLLLLLLLSWGLIIIIIAGHT